MRPLYRLSARAVATVGPGKYSDGGGLWLLKRDDGQQWYFRYTIHGRRREMGLGGSLLTLKEARELADKWRAVVRMGKDPLSERDRERREAGRNVHLFKDVTADAFEARKAELKGDGLAGRWMSPLETHILPKLGKTPVSEIDQIAIRDVLQPIWHTKADVARKALNRIGIVLKHAAALGLEVDLQAPMKAKALLGRTRHKAENIPALHWKNVPAFYASLDNGVVANALKLLILTGVRSGPLRSINENQIDGDIWTIPGEAMKGRKDATPDFRVPLSSEALMVIEAARVLAVDGNLFPNFRGRGVISNMSMSQHMKRLGMEERPHGFRSSLRDWIAETQAVPHEVAETILGHTVGGSVERAYRRTDYLEQRRKVMEDWAKHVATARVG